MGTLAIDRFNGLDLKSNVIDVKDGSSLDNENVFQSGGGVCSKRPGHEIMFASDELPSVNVDGIGSGIVGGTKYWFRFADGAFKYATSRTGALTTILPSPAISIAGKVWWEILADRLYFVDGTNVLRYFDGTSVRDAIVLSRPTVAPTGGTGTGFDYVYTVDNGNAESPAVSDPLVNKGSTSTITIAGNYGPGTLAAGNTLRIYSRATTVAAASKLVATYVWQAADVVAGTKSIATVAITDDQVQLYSELGVALNKSAPVGLTGLTVHYGRLVGWKGDRVYNAKVSNPNAWPDDNAQKEAFVYGFGIGDSEGIQTCVSYRESLFVLKKTQIAVFGGVGPDDTGGNAYSFRRLETNGLGCVAPKSAVVVGEDELSYLVFLSQQGFQATSGGDPKRIGEPVETRLIGLSDAIYSGACAFHHKRDGVYICFIGLDTDRTAWVLDVREDRGEMVGWYCWKAVNARCVFWDGDRYIFGTSLGFAASERVADLDVDFSDVKLKHFSDSSVDTVTDQILISESYQTGDAVVVRSSGTLPSPLTANTTYYAIRVDAAAIKLATTLANAQAGTAINLASQGIGQHTLVTAKAIAAYYVTNWINFGSTSRVKKVMKPSLTFNARAATVNIGMTMAYDWTPTYIDPILLTVGSAHSWGDSSLPWGSFIFGAFKTASPRNVAIPRRKFRSISYRFENSVINQDFDLQGIEQEYTLLRNRGNAA